MNEQSFLSALIVFSLVAVSPGPSVLAIMSTGMTEGRPRALALTLGILSGSSFWGLVALLGFVTVLEQMAQALIVLKIIGGLYLLYLAQKALRSALSDQEAVPLRLGKVEGLKGYYLAGLFIHLTNPKAVFGWAATITLGVGPQSRSIDAVVLVGICLAIVYSVKLTMALLFSTPVLMRAYQKARRLIQFSFAAFFTFAGMKLLLGR